MLVLKVQFLSFLLLGLTHFSQSDDYCCEFQDQTICGCSNIGQNYWTWSGIGKPDLTDITNFDIGEPGEYEWVQSPADVGDAKLITKKISIDNLDEIMIEIYRHSSSPSTAIQFNFIRIPNLYPVQIVNERLLDGWANETAVCGGTTGLQCCVTYPCEGWLQVEATLSQPSGDLIAFKNIFVNDCPVDDTTTTAATETTAGTTTPAPVYPRMFCNHFESSSDEWTLQEWEYSVDSEPDLQNIPFTPYEGDYAWTYNTTDGRIISPKVQIMLNDQYSFEYYIYSSKQNIDNSLLIYFYDIDADYFNPLNLLQSTQNNWNSLMGRCSGATPCCVTYPCNGQLILEGSYATGEVFIAVDNLQLNQGCVNTATCCDFEDSNICDMTITDVNSETTWIWSGEQSPNVSVPLANGNYMFWEVINETANPVQSTLKSDLVTVYPNSTITASYYIAFEDQSSQLQIRYHRQSDDQIIVMDFLSLTLTAWIEYGVNCVSNHGVCCSDYSGCAGWIEFLALSNGIEGNTIFGVDNLEVDSQCSSN